MENESSLQELFLKAFITELIKNTKSFSTFNEEKPESKPPKSHKLTKDTTYKSMIPSAFKTKEVKKIPQKISQVPLPKQKIPLSNVQNISQKPLPKIPLSQKKTQKPLSPEEQPNIGKLSPIIKDPRVSSLECQGPGKSVLVIKDGTIQKTQIILTAEEIFFIIDEFSQKTRIPLIKGTFKAALGELIMTAVISDFVGSRFMLQKRNSFQPLIFDQNILKKSVPKSFRK